MYVCICVAVVARLVGGVVGSISWALPDQRWNARSDFDVGTELFRGRGRWMMKGKLPGDEEELDGWIALWQLDAFGCLVSSAVIPLARL